MGASRGLAFSTNFLKTWPECWEETSCGNILLGWISKSDFSQSFWHVWQWICLHHDDPQYPKRLLRKSVCTMYRSWFLRACTDWNTLLQNRHVTLESPGPRHVGSGCAYDRSPNSFWRVCRMPSRCWSATCGPGPGIRNRKLQWGDTLLWDPRSASCGGTPAVPRTGCPQQSVQPSLAEMLLHAQTPTHVKAANSAWTSGQAPCCSSYTLQCWHM